MSEATSKGAATTMFGWAAIALACGLGYANALDAGFVYDDLVNITQRASLRWSQISLANWIGAVADSPSKRPIALATFGLQYVFGLDSARAFHAINVAIHFCNALLVAALAQHLLRRAAVLREQATRLPESWLMGASLAIALIFVAHPLQTQSVTYVVQRMNSLAAMFHLLALLFFIWGRRSASSGRRASYFALALVWWALGLGSKETALVAPVAAWLYELYFERDLNWGFVRQSGAAVLFVGIPTLVAAYVILEMSGYQPFASYPEKDFNWIERLISQPRILVFYASEFLWPAPSRLSLLHDFEVSRSLLSPATTLPAIGVVGLALGSSLVLAKRHRLVSFGLLWVFLHLAIESSVLPLALAMEHRMYLPLFGGALAIVVLAVRIFEGRAGAAIATLAVAVAMLVGATHARNEIWKTPESLWRDVLSKYPKNFSAALNLGFDLAGQNRHEEALHYYLLADSVLPGDTRVATNIGMALTSLGRHPEAIPHFRKALEIDPTNPLAPGGLGRALALSGRVEEAVVFLGEMANSNGHADAWVAHGNALLLAHRLPDARRSFLRASRTAPSWAEPQLRLGIVASQLGDSAKAVDHFERAASLSEAKSAQLESHLGLAYLGKGDAAKALVHLEAAHALSPEWTIAKNNLAWVLATASEPALRDGQRALELASSALQTNTADAEFLSTTAAALAELGRFDEAGQMLGVAISQALARKDAALATELEARAETYAAARAAGEASE